MKAKWIGKCVLFGALAVTVFTTVVMLLWNNLVPDLFNGPHITWLQALGLLILSKILFKGGPGRGSPWHRHWRERMEAKMNAMTPEERERFRQQWRNRCGHFGKKQDSSPESTGL